MEPYTKDNQLTQQRQELVAADQEEVTVATVVSSLSEQLKTRLYQPGDINTMHRLEIAVGTKQPPEGYQVPEVPAHLTAGLLLLAYRKGGRRVGLEYNLVTDKELTKLALEMIPAMCLFMGVQMDSAYMAMAYGIAQHIRRLYPKLTLEELELFTSKIYEVPVEHMPTSYKVFDMRKMATVLEVYVKYVISAQMGAAGAWLMEHCKTDYDVLFEARRSLKALPGKRAQQPALSSSSYGYPPETRAHLLEACKAFNEAQPTRANFYQIAKIACGATFTLLVEYIEAELLTLGKGEQQFCYNLAWSYMMAESVKHTQTSYIDKDGKKKPGGRKANQPRYARMVSQKLNAEDERHLLYLIRRHRAALQMFNWYKAGVEPPESKKL